MLQLADDKKVLKQLEDKILKLLSESSGASGLAEPREIKMQIMSMSMSMREHVSS